MTAKCYAVVTADIVESRKTESFTGKRDRILNTISTLHLKEEFTLSPYTITAWDEFEVILSEPAHLPRVLLDIRRFFVPLQLRIAVGLGAASGVRKRPINAHSGGEAFERARLAADRLKLEFSKYRVLTRFESGNQIFDTIANTIYRLQDSLIQGTTQKQWSTINAQIGTGRQDATAKRMKLDVSTVSRNLKRGYYWHQLETIEAMERIIQSYF
jgi:hypothetical protein